MMKVKNLPTKCSPALISIFLILALIAIGCAPKGPGVVKEKIKIGFGLPLTGFMAPGAEGQLNSYLLWADDVNAKGGINVKEYGKRLPVELVYYDDRSSPEETIKIYEKLLTTDKVDLLLAPYSEYGHMAVVPTVEKHGVPLVGNTCGAMEIAKFDVRYFWFVGVLHNKALPPTADMLSANKDEISSVAILYVHDVFPIAGLNSLKPRLEQEGFDIVLLKDYPIGVTDLSPVLLEIKEKKPDALIFLSYPGDGLLIMGQAIELGLDAKLIYFLLGAAIAAFPQIYGPATEGITSWHLSPWNRKGPGPGSQEFHDRYVERFEGIDYENSPLAYVSCQVLEQAVEKAGTLDWEKIRDTIATEEFTTLYGSFKFVGMERVPLTPAVAQWQKGEFEMVWPPEYATAELIIPKPPWPK